MDTNLPLFLQTRGMEPVFGLLNSRRLVLNAQSTSAVISGPIRLLKFPLLKHRIIIQPTAAHYVVKKTATPS